MKFLVRFAGEIAIKSPHVRRQFLSRLTHNIRTAMKNADLSGSVTQEWGRVWVESDSSLIVELLSQVYGIQSFSPVEYSCPSDMESILETGKNYASVIEGKTFAVKARRAGTHPYSSMDIQKNLGGMLNQGRGQVCLTRPDVTVSVQVRDDICRFFSQVIPGPGGLPLGTGGKAVCLMSGGFDSPVAAWMMQKRGISMDYLLCNMAGDAYERSVLKVCKWLCDHWSHGTKPKFHVVDFAPVVEELKNKVSSRYTQVVLKRLFYRVGEMLAKETKAEALVTGEAIAQVSSQTLTNLRAIEDVADVPVMRPLIAFDKEDIIKLSRKIGTCALSSGILEFCQVVPVKPATSCPVSVARDEESQFDLTILENVFADRKILVPGELSQSELTSAYLYQDSVEADAVVVDCRSKSEFDQWHYQGSTHIDYYDLADSWKKHFSKDQKILIYCSVGMQSAILAEKMQSDGYLAYSFKGGARALMKLAESEN